MEEVHLFRRVIGSHAKGESSDASNYGGPAPLFRTNERVSCRRQVVQLVQVSRTAHRQATVP